MRKLAVLMGFLGAVALGGPMLAQDAPSAGTVVATVNGAEVTLGDLIAARAALPPEYDQLPPESLFNGLLEQIIQQTAIEQTMEGKLSLQDELTLKAQRSAYVAGKAVRAAVDAAATDAALQAAYDEMFKDFTPSKEFHAAHILVPEEARATDLKAEIDAGADFGELAKANSMDGSAAGGGDLGWFGMGMMVEPFEQAVVAAEVGKVTGPVQTEFGWHLILVTETRNSAKPTLEDMRNELTAQVQEAAVASYVDGVVSAATVDRTGAALDPALINDITLLGN